MYANKKIILLVSILLTTAILLSGCGKTTGSETPLSSADNVSSSGFPAKMPSFTTKDLDGNTVTESIFSEKDLTIINIWGTFCPPCIGEMPELSCMEHSEAKSSSYWTKPFISALNVSDSGNPCGDLI